MNADHIATYSSDEGRSRAECSCGWTAVRRDQDALKQIAEAHLAANYSAGKTSLRRQPRFGPLTAQAKGALQFLAARGEMTVGVANEFVRDTVSGRTAWALERRGYAERRWSYGPDHDSVIYITDEGQRVADEQLGELDEDAWD